ncbi:MAG: vWA domain-containing protein, partial [Actinomycetota bacterium]
MNEVLDRLVGFGRLLRARGLPVGTGRILTYCRAVVALSPIDRDRLYWAGRTTLVARKQDFEAYDRAFRDYFDRSRLKEALAPLFEHAAGSAREKAAEEEGPDVTEQDVVAAGWEPAGDEPTEGEAAIRVVATAGESLKNKDFEDLTLDERMVAAALIRRLAIRIPLRRSRRLRPAPKGSRFDVRRTLRASLKTEGEPFTRAWRNQRLRMRPLVLVLDVSGSMSAYSRALMQFGFAAMRAGQRVEVFCFGTRLTRVTRALRTKDPDHALKAVSRLVQDWEGGTRIGESLKQMLDTYGQQASIRGAIVVLCSDGLERGDPGLLASQMERLDRMAHRLIWVNPLKGSPRYEPLARGMAAALPHV